MTTERDNAALFAHSEDRLTVASDAPRLRRRAAHKMASLMSGQYASLSRFVGGGSRTLAAKTQGGASNVMRTIGGHLATLHTAAGRGLDAAARSGLAVVHFADAGVQAVGYGVHSGITTLNAMESRLVGGAVQVLRASKQGLRDTTALVNETERRLVRGSADLLRRMSPEARRNEARLEAFGAYRQVAEAAQARAMATLAEQRLARRSARPSISMARIADAAESMKRSVFADARAFMAGTRSAIVAGAEKASRLSRFFGDGARALSAGAASRAVAFGDSLNAGIERAGDALTIAAERTRASGLAVGDAINARIERAGDAFANGSARVRAGAVVAGDAIDAGLQRVGDAMFNGMDRAGALAGRARDVGFVAAGQVTHGFQVMARPVAHAGVFYLAATGLIALAGHFAPEPASLAATHLAAAAQVNLGHISPLVDLGTTAVRYDAVLQHAAHHAATVPHIQVAHDARALSTNLSMERHDALMRKVIAADLNLAPGGVSNQRELDYLAAHGPHAAASARTPHLLPLDGTVDTKSAHLLPLDGTVANTKSAHLLPLDGEEPASPTFRY